MSYNFVADNTGLSFDYPFLPRILAYLYGNLRAQGAAGGDVPDFSRISVSVTIRMDRPIILPSLCTVSDVTYCQNVFFCSFPLPMCIVTLIP